MNFLEKTISMGNFISTGGEILQKLEDEQRNELVSIAKFLLREEDKESELRNKLMEKYSALVAEIKNYLKT